MTKVFPGIKREQQQKKLFSVTRSVAEIKTNVVFDESKSVTDQHRIVFNCKVEENQYMASK